MPTTSYRTADALASLAQSSRSVPVGTSLVAASGPSRPPSGGARADGLRFAPTDPRPLRDCRPSHRRADPQRESPDRERTARDRDHSPHPPLTARRATETTIPFDVRNTYRNGRSNLRHGTTPLPSECSPEWTDGTVHSGRAPVRSGADPSLFSVACGVLVPPVPEPWGYIFRLQIEAGLRNVTRPETIW